MSASASAPPDANGGTPRGYDIIGRVGAGGMGEVYKARHRLLDEYRAIKVMKPSSGGDRSAAQRFEREAKICSRLEHPNIARLYDFSVAADGTSFMVLEWVDGTDLRELLAASGPPPVLWTLEVARQALDALAYLHRKGIVHRDVSPDNLMVTRGSEQRPRVKLVDLGIARRLWSDDGLTQTGQFLGKIRYAAPEAFTGLASGGSTRPDLRSDIYSMGVVLYELLTGLNPIAGSSQASLLSAKLTGRPRSFEDSDPTGRVPPALRAVVLKALEKDPLDRYQTALELAEALAATNADTAVEVPLFDFSEASTQAAREVDLPAASQPELVLAQRLVDRQFSAAGQPLSAALESPSEEAVTLDSSDVEVQDAAADPGHEYSSIGSTFIRMIREHPTPFAVLSVAITVGMLLLFLLSQPSTGEIQTNDADAEPGPAGAVASSPARTIEEGESPQSILASGPRSIAVLTSGDAPRLLPYLDVAGRSSSLYPTLAEAVRTSSETGRRLLALQLEIETRDSRAEAYEVALPFCEVTGSLLIVELPEMAARLSRRATRQAPTCAAATEEILRTLGEIANSTLAARSP